VILFVLDVKPQLNSGTGFRGTLGARGPADGGVDGRGGIACGGGRRGARGGGSRTGAGAAGLAGGVARRVGRRVRERRRAAPGRRTPRFLLSFTEFFFNFYLVSFNFTGFLLQF